MVCVEGLTRTDGGNQDRLRGRLDYQRRHMRREVDLRGTFLRGGRTDACDSGLCNRTKDDSNREKDNKDPPSHGATNPHVALPASLNSTTRSWEAGCDSVGLVPSWLAHPGRCVGRSDPRRFLKVSEVDCDACQVLLHVGKRRREGPQVLQPIAERRIERIARRAIPCSLQFRVLALEAVNQCIDLTHLSPDRCGDLLNHLGVLSHFWHFDPPS